MKRIIFLALVALGILVFAILVAGCGSSAGEDSPSGDSVDAARSTAVTQRQLDELMDAQASDMVALDEAYPDDDSDAAVMLAFADALAAQDGVTNVERIEDWKVDAPIPCGNSERPDQAVLAQGADDEFFVGRASVNWIAGFAEDGEDIGMVVAACQDGQSGELHVINHRDPEPFRHVSILSFAADGSSGATLLDQFFDEPRASPDKSVVLDENWTLDDPIQCAAGDDIIGLQNFEGSSTGAFGIASSDAVALHVEIDAEDTGSFAAECANGTATGFRRIARPISETR